MTFSTRESSLKSTGIIRKIDELGRIVLPMEVRRTFGIDTRDPLEIFIDGKRIILSKIEEVCHFCASSKNIRTFKGKKVCRACQKAISGMD